MVQPTYMSKEIQEIPQAVDALLSDGRGAIKRAASALRQADPVMVLTVARGSSDHAALYLKYACEVLLGVPVASVGPSIASVYGTQLKLGNAACIAISQSGQSPDIVQMAQSARRGGATCVAITNDATAPLARASNLVVPLTTGPELSVAATKTYVASLVAGLAVLAHWKEDADLLSAIDDLPARLKQAASIDWPELRAETRVGQGMYVLGRGLSLAVSNEAALKFKETCQIHAESYSSAEVLHGPVSLVDEGFPVLAFVSRDASEPGIVDVCDQLARQGARVFATSHTCQTAQTLEFVSTGHALTDPIALIVSFYAFVEKLARERGGDPDTPRHLRKVTQTV